jgi:hypothetical protein
VTGASHHRRAAGENTAMTRTNGQSSRSILRSENPHQVLVLAETVRGRTFNRVLAFHEQAGIRIKNCTDRKNDKWHLLYCFKERENAVAFQSMFGGESLDRT